MLFWQEKILQVFSLKSYLMQVCKPCHYALVDAVEPLKLHPMSMAYICEKFELSRGNFGGMIILPAKITSTHFE